MSNRKLRVTAALIGTPLERPAQAARWAVGARHRMAHPELWAMHLEPRRVDRSFAALVRTDSNCIDVGAHLGKVTHRFCELAPRGDHVAIEAVPEKAAELTRRFPNVRVVQAAVGAAEGTASFHEDLGSSGFSGLHRNPNQSASGRDYEVRVARLDDLIDAETRVDFVKIDIEGGELDALRGATRIIERWHPAVIFECGPEAALQAIGHGRADLHDYFTTRGYVIWSPLDYVFARPPVGRDEFVRQGVYPFAGFDYLALTPQQAPTERLVG